MQRSIRVCATGVFSAAPDLIRASVKLSGVRETYEKAAEDFKSSFDLLIERAGDEFSFKTADFFINAHYTEERDRSNAWSKKFAGYLFSHTLCCEFGFDTAKLGRFVSVLSRCECVESFGFDYALSDLEKATDAACSLAVKNASAKAKTLADAAGVRLGEIVSVEFRASSRNAGAARMYKMNDRAAVMSASLEISPSDLTIAETVEITWELI